MNGRPSLGATLEYWAAIRPEAPFVSDIDDNRRLSYRDCLWAVRGAQWWLGPERQTIVLTLPGGAATAVIWLAALTAGHRIVPCSPDATPDEKARLTATYRPDVLVVERAEDADTFEPDVVRVLSRGRLNALIGIWTRETQCRPALTTGEPGEFCLTTSGTTGVPKGVTLREDQIAWTADQIRRGHRLTTEDRGLSVLPFFHINAPVVSLCTTLMAGGALAIAPRFSRTRFWDWIAAERITWASIVPTIVAVLLQTEPPSWLPGELRFIRTASAPLPVVQLRAFEQRFGISLIETYGLSEAASTVAANPVPPERRRVGSVGRPLVPLRVCEPSVNGAALCDVPRGAEGEICIAGPSLIDGYDGGAGASAFRDGWFRTGDLGRQDEDGYVYVTGRLKEVINRGGEKIPPREIEEVLLAHPLVRDAGVIGQPDPIYGEQPVAYVVPVGPDDRDLEETLLAYCRERLSAYKVPVAVVPVEGLPRTRTGKLQRHVLRESQAPAAVAGLRYGVA